MHNPVDHYASTEQAIDWLADSPKLAIEELQIDPDDDSAYDDCYRLLQEIGGIVDIVRG